MLRAMRFHFWLTASLLCSAATGLAIVDANTTANTVDPADGSPWAYVGGVNGASGEYLGNGWVLTAYHVGVGSITLDSGTYQPDGRVIRLTNPADGSPTDMLLYHLILNPAALSSLALSATTPVFNSSVDMQGFGHIRGSAQKTYGAYTGYDWSAGTIKSYGTNRVASGGVVTQADLGYGALRVFAVNFSQSGTANEGQGSIGDSGGAIFYKRNGTTWELAGMIDSIGSYVYPSSASVFGDVTYSGDIATYNSQISSIVAATLGNGAWNGATNTTWATATNWSGAGVPGTAGVNTATFNGSGNNHTTVSLGSGVAINTILFDNPSGSLAAYTLGSGSVGSQTLTLNNGGAVTVSDAVSVGQVINAAAILGTDATLQTYTISNNSTQAGSSLTFAGNISGATGGTAGLKTLAILGAGNTIISGNITDGGATHVTVTKTTAGTVTLTGANTFSGGTNISGGVLSVNGDSALGVSSGVVNISNGATLRAVGAVTTTARTITLGNGGGVIDTNGYTVNLAGGGALTGTSLTKVGNGTLTLAGTQTYTTLTASAGTTNVNSALGTGGSTVNVNAIVNFGASQTLAGLNIGAGATAAFSDASALSGFEEDASLVAPPAVAVVPEPASVGLLLAGAAGLAARRRRAAGC
jgi:autotransporter-associated beta strand protein